MRCLPLELAENLKRKPASLYFLYGTEMFLIEESAMLIRQTILALPNSERVTLTLDGNHALEDLKTLLGSPSLFSTQQFIDIQCAAKISDKEISALVEVIESADHKQITFLIQAHSLPRQFQQSKWFTTLQQQGWVIPHYALSTPQLTQWLKLRAKQKNLPLSEQLCASLMQYAENNCLIMAQEIDRLALIALGGDTPNLVYLEEKSQFDVFRLCEAMLKQQSARVLKILERMKDVDAPLQLIIWALAQCFRVLVRCRLTPTPSARLQLFLQAGIRTQIQPIYLEALKSTSCQSDELAALTCLFSADKQLKSGNIRGAWHMITHLCLKHAGTLLKFDVY